MPSCRCEFITQGETGRSHVRVFHDKQEQGGAQHSCRKLAHYHVHDNGVSIVRHEHDEYTTPCDCMCYDGEPEGALSGAAAVTSEAA